MPDRGLSDVIGFILVFALILSSIAIVYATGFENLDTMREQEERKNVERAFDILDDNLRSVFRGEAPGRGTEIQLGDSQLYLGDPVIVTANVTNLSNGAVNTSKVFIYPIVYETSNGDRILYVGGTTIRDVRGGKTMITEPPIVIDENNKQLLFGLMETRPDSSTVGVSGGTVLVRGRQRAAEVIEYNNDPSSNSYEVNFTIESPRTGLWETYCKDKKHVIFLSKNSTAVECSIDVEFEQVFINFKQININIL